MKTIQMLIAATSLALLGNSVAFGNPNPLTAKDSDHLNDQRKAGTLVGLDTHYYSQSKQIWDERGKPSWRLGLKMQPNPTFKKFMAAGHRGMFYTGKVVVRRWGAHADVPMESYHWNLAEGERWMVMAEVIEGGARPGICWQGANATSGWNRSESKNYFVRND